MSSNKDPKPSGRRLKLFGTAIDGLPDAPLVAKSTTIENRPGGWVVARTVSESGAIVQKRGAYVEPRATTGIHRFFTWSREYAFSGEWLVKKRGGQAAGHDLDDSQLIAQFPGKVRKLMVQVGAKVEKGTKLLVVEAMKMEFTIEAPFAGVIEKIQFQEGEQIQPGSKLVEIKPDLSNEGKK